MPGLSQLRRLSEDVLRLGNEPKLRAERGEKPVLAVIPPTVEDIDDSEDFVLGMPEKDVPEVSDEEIQRQQEEQAALQSAASDLEALLSGNQNASSPEPDLSGLLNPMGDMSDGVPDLSAFEEPPEPPKKEEPSIADMDLDALLSAPSEDFSEPEPVPESETKSDPVDFSATSEINIDDLINGTGSNSTEKPEPKSVPEPEVPEIENLESLDAEPVDEITPLEEVSDLSGPENSQDDFEMPDMGGIDFGSDDNSGNVSESQADAKDIPLEVNDDFDSNDEFSFDGDSIDLNADIPEELREEPPEVKKPSSDEQKISLESEELPNSSDEFNEMPQMDFSVPEDMGESDSATEPAGEEEKVTDEIPTSGDFGFDEISTDGLDDFGAAQMDAGLSPDASGAPGDDSSTGDIDLSGLNLNMDDEAPPEESETPEVFDAPEMAGIDFSGEASGPNMSDFGISDTDAQISGANDFQLDEESAGEPDFEIEGFTGEDANPFDKSGHVKVQVAEPKEEKKEKNTLTDAEYKKFKANLNYYPLNVRLTVEDMIVKNEFTDTVIFEVIEKILKKVPARQLAAHLEKLLDIQLSVPRDFERRTAEEYEAYKASIQYQLKNRILPIAIIGTFIFLVGLCSFYLGNMFIVSPLRAEKYYREGYALLENNEYPQSEISFNKALDFKQKKKWFFKYAQGYRSHKQYDRAELMYKNILRRFDHDKQGGLEYVEMELYDLANYEKAEQIVKREILDYHINDADAILILGDVYLEWATEEDPSKFDDAKEQYSILLQLYEPKNEYLARMMRYNVRTDNLLEVLQYKETFYPDEKSLSGDDWTEMSGYLMDKLYGNLLPNEEYLRSSIEDVHGMLTRAVKYSPANPVSRYNIARYFIETHNHEKATEALKKTLQLFDSAESIKKRDVYKQLNSYRLLGEEYIYSREYILAQQTLSNGIDFYEEKNQMSGLESDKNVGIMYSDMGDLDYFISGDLENAERNYINSINCKNDNASLRYRVGYINYGNQNYDDALKHFVIASRDAGNDKNLLLALGNTLSLRDDNYASAGYYERLVDSLEIEMQRGKAIAPLENEKDKALVTSYLHATNNLGVSLYRLARQSGNSRLNGQSIVNLQNSLKAWDTLSRNPVTMERLDGTNLAEQNIKYITHPVASFEPAIYTELPRLLENERPLN